MLLRRFLFITSLFIIINSEIIEVIKDSAGNETDIWTNEDEEVKEQLRPPVAVVPSIPRAEPIQIETTTSFQDECLPKLDLVFLLDTSGSIEEIYQEHVRWAVALVDSLQIEPDAVHVAAVQYAGFPLTEFALGTYPTVDDIRQHLKQISFQSGVTRTGYALRKAEAELFREDRGARKDALKVIILFTDGLSIDDPLKPAAQLRDLKGVKIYVVSVGNDGFESEMSRIAGNKDNVFGPDELPRLRTALLNDAERARACSQIGAAWLRRQESTTLKTPASILNQGILPPLDFLELVEDSQEAENEKKENEIKKVIGEVKPEVEFLHDNLNKKNQEKKIADTKNVKDILINESEEEISDTIDKISELVTTKPTTRASSTSAPTKPSTTTSVRTTTVKPKTTSVRTTTVKPKTTSSIPPTTKARASSVVKPLTKTTVPKLEKNEKEVSVPKLQKKINKEVPSAQKIFAVPVFRPPIESEDITDVFDMDDKERKQFQSFNPTTKTPSFTKSNDKNSPYNDYQTNNNNSTYNDYQTNNNNSTYNDYQTNNNSTYNYYQTNNNNSTYNYYQTSDDNETENYNTKSIQPSGSVQKIYDQQKEFLKQILQETNLQENVHQVALLQFAGSAIQKTEWSFDTYSNTSDLMTALERVRFITGTTYIGAALENALQLLENRRRNVPAIVILVSDGFSQDDATKPSERIRKLNTLEFYSLSIAELTNSDYLTQLVGSPDNVFSGKDADQLKNLLIKKLHCS
ncbi:hypothetical protein FO519_001114 [Halicephalobus sp. NKZ332]|nr:hypothetical protein FO519_001114 [Halicephalobus sp. NKZ332]